MFEDVFYSAEGAKRKDVYLTLYIEKQDTTPSGMVVQREKHGGNLETYKSF